MWNLETGNTRLLALPHHKQAYQFEKQIISIINELGIWITCCWCWVLWLDLTHIKNSLLSVVGCLHIASSTCLLTAGIANRTEIGEHWDMAGGHLSAGPLWFKQGSGVHRPFLRATLLTHPPKPAMAGALQMLQAACCPVNATLPCCKEADPANPDRWKENQLSAFLTANFYRVGVPPPPSYNFFAKLFLSSGLHLVCLHGVEVLCPGLRRRLRPWPPPADGASWVLRRAQQPNPQGCLFFLQQLYVAGVPGYWDSQILSAVLLPLCTCAFRSVRMFRSTFFHLNCVLICCLVILLPSFPSPEVSSDGLLISYAPFPCSRSWCRNEFFAFYNF